MAGAVYRTYYPVDLGSRFAAVVNVDRAGNTNKMDAIVSVAINSTVVMPKLFTGLSQNFRLVKNQII